MKTIQMILALVLSFNTAWAVGDSGNGAGNGGGMHYCPGKKIQEMYDVYEGRERYRLTIPSTGFTVPEETIINNAIFKLARENVTFAEAVKKQIVHLASPENFSLDELVKLALVPDANILRVDEGCEYRQLANWDDATNCITVKKSLYNVMDTFGQAALKLHEAVYKAARLRNGVTDSDIVRRLVAELLSTLERTTQAEHFRLKNDLAGGPKDAGMTILGSKEFNIQAGKKDIPTEEISVALSLGPIGFEDISNFGTMKVSVREFKEAAKKDRALVPPNLSGLSRKEREKAESEYRSRVRATKHRTDYKYDSGYVEKWANDAYYGWNGGSTPLDSDANRKGSEFAVQDGELLSEIYLSSDSFPTVTVDFEFTKFDGTSMTLSRVVKLKGYFIASDHLLFRFHLSGSLE